LEIDIERERERIEREQQERENAPVRKKLNNKNVILFALFFLPSPSLSLSSSLFPTLANK
jgi:hypothetical protein